MKIKQLSQAQSGRSMVEILGVMAVIGVLSIGGIQGYKYAMDKYRANDIVNEVNLRATDIWHMYQDGEKELPDLPPDTDAFPEYGERTQTGFEIMVTSHPPVAFRTWVNDVPSDVCKKVLQENLNDIITGLRFIQVNGDKYNGDINICGEGVADNQMVFTSFLDEGGGAVGKPDPNNPFEYCVEEGDCTGGCGSVCNPRTMRCEDSCMGTDKPYCKETESGGVCVKCTQRNHCTDLGENYTCSDLTNECVEVPAKCVEGKEFRTKNGICVACDNASNFMVGLDKFAVPELEIEDDLTGLEQCNACANPNTRYSGTVDEETAYCSYACTKGYSFQTANSGCVSCTDTEGYLIINENVSVTQCLACQDHFWYWSGSWPSSLMCDTDRCKTGESFIHFQYDGRGGDPGKCVSCNADGCFQVGTSNTNSMGNKNFFVNKCLACGNRFMHGAYCCKYCKQPDNAEAQIEICKVNPKDERCTRKWENTSGQCMSCSESGTNTFVGKDAIEGGTDPNGLGALCRACGRVVTEDGYCVSSIGCGENQFLGIDGICYECNKSGHVKVKSSDDKDSGCIANCENTTDSKWYKGRRILSFTYNKEIQYYCYRKPLDGIQSIQDARTGNFYNCSDTGSYFFNHQSREIITILEDECESRCNKNGNIVRLAESDRCNIVKCPEVNGKKQFQMSWGLCRSCDSTNPEELGFSGKNYPTKDSYSERVKERIKDCEDCGNHMFVNIYYSGSYYPKCYFVNPGVSGVCNNINTEIPSTLNSKLAEQASQYMNANTGLFRDTNGYCRSCTDKTSYSASQIQCNICPNRRYNNNQCIYGLCEEKSQFLNASNTCVACTSKNVAVNPKKENLCSSCDNRRMLTTGFEEQENLAGLCVEECAPGLWQGKNGTCYFANNENTYEIGTDTESRTLCTNVGREVVEIVDNDDNVIGYECALK